MQNKLATWATEDKERKFNRLLRLMASESWLQEAARVTLASSGAHTPGIDGMTKQQMGENLNEQLAEIRTQLLEGTYLPLPAKRVYIPKANGKQRPLGIPALRDRIVQRAMLMVMDGGCQDSCRMSDAFYQAAFLSFDVSSVFSL